jgi:hypothetical protein
MHPSLHPSGVSLADAERRYKNAFATIMQAYRAMDPAPVDQVTPQQLHAGIEQFLIECRQLDDRHGQSRCAEPEEVSRLGEYGITLLMDLYMWARRLGLEDMESEFDVVVLAFADWTTRHAGELRTIEPIVDALANLANRTRDANTLERLTHLMTRVIRATAAPARGESGRSLPTRSWRLLHLNRGIVATRTHNAALMEQVFDELVQHIPGEAQQFFAEGMQQMDALKYPGHVREVMARYFDRWTRTRMH